MTLWLGLIFAANTFAADLPYGNISCETQRNLPKNAFDAQYTLKAKLIPYDKVEATMRDIVMTAKGEFDGETAVGRRQYVSGRVSKLARKYTNHYNFEMDKLVDANDFGDFLPMDSCSIKVKIPNDAVYKKTFEAPVVTNCDQSGGSQTMDCTFTEIRR